MIKYILLVSTQFNPTLVGLILYVGGRGIGIDMGKRTADTRLIV